MKKYIIHSSIFITLIILANKLFASELTTRTNNTITWQITIGEKTKTGENPIVDKVDQSSCDALRINWPKKNGAELYNISTLCSDTNRPNFYPGPIENFTGKPIPNEIKAVTTKSMKKQVDENLLIENLFIFPTALPSTYLKELINNDMQKIHTFPSAKLIMVIQNDKASLKKMGLIKEPLINKKFLVPAFLTVAGLSIVTTYMLWFSQ